VGTCVGVGGVRIKPILKELGGEKIDIIATSSVQEEVVKNALKPAEINRVEVINNIARVWLDDEQRSLAIGKMGKNIALASALLDLDIELVENISANKKELTLDVNKHDE
jgi:N utilization substance protein A